MFIKHTVYDVPKKAFYVLIFTLLFESLINHSCTVIEQVLKYLKLTTTYTHAGVKQSFRRFHCCFTYNRIEGIKLQKYE